MLESQKDGISSPAGLAGLGSAGVSSIAVVMLFQVQTSGGEMHKVLTQHGEELNMIRQTISHGSNTTNHFVKEIELDVLKVSRELQQIASEHENLRRLVTDKDARPDAFGRTDWRVEIQEHTTHMKTWVKNWCMQTWEEK